MSIKNAVFDGYDFAVNGLTISMVDMQSRTPKNLQLEGRAIEDGSVLVSSRYGAKPVMIEGRFSPRATTDDLEMAIDAWILAMSGDSRVLDVTHAGGVRRFIATAQAPIIRRERGAATTAGFSIEFVVPEGFGSDVDVLQLLNSTTTAQSADLAMVIGGSYKAQPDITLTVNSLTDGGPNKSINIFNPATTEGITITRSWVAGDSVVFNARNRAVYLNNSQIYARGAFPSWQPGSNQTLSYFDDFTARNVTIFATYTRRWL